MGEDKRVAIRLKGEGVWKQKFSSKCMRCNRDFKLLAKTSKYFLSMDLAVFTEGRLVGISYIPDP